MSDLFLIEKSTIDKIKKYLNGITNNIHESDKITIYIEMIEQVLKQDLIK